MKQFLIIWYIIMIPLMCFISCYTTNENELPTPPKEKVLWRYHCSDSKTSIAVFNDIKIYYPNATVLKVCDNQMYVILIKDTIINDYDTTNIESYIVTDKVKIINYHTKCDYKRYETHDYTSFEVE